MTNDTLDIDDLLRDLRPTLVAVYQRGYRAGGEAMKRAIQQLVSEPDVDADAGVGATTQRVEPQGGIRERGPEPETPRRAPRGLAEQAVKHIFEAQHAIATKDLENLVLQFDDRVNPKTVYNILLRRKDEFRQDRGRWVRHDTDGWLLNPRAAE